MYRKDTELYTVYIPVKATKKAVNIELSYWPLLDLTQAEVSKRFPVILFVKY